MRLPATLDHFVLAVPDLPAARADFAGRTGIEPAVGGRHLGSGTANYLLGLGGAAYLEIIGPDPDVDDRPAHLPFGIERILTPTLITWAVRTGSIEASLAYARARSYDPGTPAAMSRQTTDGVVLRWQLTPHTIDAEHAGGGVVPFLIDWGVSAHPTSRALPLLTVAEFVVCAPEPTVVEQRLSALGVALRVRRDRRPHLELVLDTPRGQLAYRN